ncbi:hypothetical protein DK871_22805 [Pseudomonas sp. L13]|nr:hypothetical protein [Pseudomonas sp. L13]
MLTFALFKSEPLSERNPKWPLPQEWMCTQSNCVDCQAVFAGKPAPTFGSRCLSSISVGCQAVTGKPGSHSVLCCLLGQAFSSRLCRSTNCCVSLCRGSR